MLVLVPGSAALKSPRMTVGEKRLRSPAARPRTPAMAVSSGRRTTSRARARCGRRRMKPRSSSPLIRRWMPDLDLRPKASFISSKEGETPPSESRRLMKTSSSYCFRVSIGHLRGADPDGTLEQNQNPIDVLVWFARSVKRQLSPDSHSIWGPHLGATPQPVFPRKRLRERSIEQDHVDVVACRGGGRARLADDEAV